MSYEQLPKPPQIPGATPEMVQWLEQLWLQLTGLSEIVNAGGAIGDIKVWWQDELPEVGTWAWCHGDSILRIDYPEWVAIHGTRFGTADADHVNLPKVNGRFLRFRDAGATVDPDAAARTAMATGGEIGDKVGTVQGEQFKAHDHGMTTTASGQPLNNWVSGNYAMPASTGFTAGISWAAGGSETRPKNVTAELITRLA